MFRTSDIVMLGVIVASAAFTYKTKHEAEARVAEIHKIQSQIRYEEDTISVLKADWSRLTQPGRLEKLVKAYDAELELKNVEASQFAAVKDLPERPLTIEELTADSNLADLGNDPITTGALPQ